MLDNPGLVTQACGNVLDKWDGVWREKEADLANTYRLPGSEGAAATGAYVLVDELVEAV